MSLFPGIPLAKLLQALVFPSQAHIWHRVAEAKSGLGRLSPCLCLLAEGQEHDKSLQRLLSSFYSALAAHTSATSFCYHGFGCRHPLYRCHGAMSGQDRPGISGLSWSAFGGRRSPTAWGGAAAELQTPPSTVREAMRADEAQVHTLPEHAQYQIPSFQSACASHMPSLLCPVKQQHTGLRPAEGLPHVLCSSHHQTSICVLC